MTTLGKIVSFKTGKLDSNAAVSDGLYPFYTCAQEAYKTNTYSFDTEAVVLAGNNANGVYAIRYVNEKFDAYQRTYIIEPLKESASEVDVKYLYYALRLRLKELQSLSTGAATKFLTKSILTSLEIELPPVEIQRTVSTILGDLDDLIEINNKKIKCLEQMARRIFREWFVDFRFPGHENVKMVDSGHPDLGMIPEGWKVTNLFDLCDVGYGYAFKSSEFNENGCGKKIVRIRNILDGYSNIFTTETANEKYLVTEGDFLVGMDGIFHTGNWTDGDALLVQRVARVRPKLKNYLGFISIALRKPIKDFEQALVGTTVAHLGDQHLKTISLCCPPQMLVIHLDQLLKLKIKLAKTIRTLGNLRDLLVPKLISGEIDLSELAFEEEPTGTIRLSKSAGLPQVQGDGR